MLRRAFTLSLALTLPLLAACGDKGPSKQEFLAKADPICKQANDVAAALSTPSAVEGIKDYVNKLGQTTGDTALKLSKLDFPKGKDGTAAKAMVASLRTASESGKAVVPEVDKGNYPGIEAGVTKMNDSYKAANDQARVFGSAECGKGEADAAAKLNSSTGPTVKQAFITKADALCKVANDQIDNIDEGDTIQSEKVALDQIASLAEKLTADIKALPQPTTDKAKLDEVYKAQDDLIVLIKQARDAAAAGDEAKLEDVFSRADALSNSANAKADAYGFKDCGSEGA